MGLFSSATANCNSCGNSVPKGRTHCPKCVKKWGKYKGGGRATEARMAEASRSSSAPRPCPNRGCGRTMRGGVCPGPNC